MPGVALVAVLFQGTSGLLYSGAGRSLAGFIDNNSSTKPRPVAAAAKAAKLVRAREQREADQRVKRDWRLMRERTGKVRGGARAGVLPSYWRRGAGTHCTLLCFLCIVFGWRRHRGAVRTR